MTNYGPCSAWTPIWTCPDKIATASPVATGYAAQAATEIVWALSGRQFGLCSVTLRPCRKSCFDSSWWSTFGGTWYGESAWGIANGYGYSYSGPWGFWFDPSCGQCMGSCSCTQISEVDLPSPVSSIVSVKMDGTPMVTGAYRLDNDHLLVRTDGQKWPRCNDMTKDDTQPGTWSVTALYGQDVPVSGQLAVGEMACELLRAINGEDCRLPAGLQSVARQGVTINFANLGDLMKEGITGFDLVDRFIGSVNPYKLQERSRVYSVDRPSHRRTGR